MHWLRVWSCTFNERIIVGPETRWLTFPYSDFRLYPGNFPTLTL